MIKIEKPTVYGFEEAIRGMRNSWESWDESDTTSEIVAGCANVGPNDLKLMEKLARSGPSHAKFRRMIVAYMHITAPLYWWKEFDTYKVGTVANSCSTMHKIQAKPFTLEDFSHERCTLAGRWSLCRTCIDLNHARNGYLETGNQDYWDTMIQILPSSYNQKRTVMLNYEVLSNIYNDRLKHKLSEWREFCRFCSENLPYSTVFEYRRV